MQWSPRHSYCMEDPEQAFVEYASSRTNEVGVQKNDDFRKEEPKAGEQKVEYFDMLPTRSELTYHKIEQYNSLSDLEKEHTKPVYLRNEKDKRRGMEYVMSKILGFYKECLELGPEYVTGIDDEEEVT
ncbi:hypothetical protein Tco_0290027 [Tanacetum coccineum]